MKRIVILGCSALLLSSCSHVGNIDHDSLKTPQSYTLSTGQTIKLPLVYKDWQWMMASYSVPVSQIQALLPSKLKPIELSQGKALISFGVLEFPNVAGIQPYDEWLISIPVQYENTSTNPFIPAFYNPLFPHSIYKKGGSYVYYLPVTTTESQQVGSEIWGYPKVKRTINCSESKTQKTCDLLDNGQLEMSLSIDKLPPSYRNKNFTYCSYTEKNQQLLRTCIPAKGNYGYSIFGKASITFGNGAISDVMKKLDINKDKPMQVFVGSNLDSTLPLAYETLKK